ncbi:hypothetical protein XENTR_v10021789 [Xenopus tropicalis]|nr:hypothetical protein XENTR_v10021789 [Xenopus tropicalis]
MQEHWDVQGTGTEHSIRITTVQKTIISPESQIVDKTSPAQLYEIKREYKVEDINETFAPTEEELKPTKEMAEAATLDTGLSKRDVSLKVAEETVEKATETQDTQITESKTQVAESSLSETQLSTISTLEFGQPDQAAIPDSSDATPKPKEDIKRELEEREGETKSEYISTVAKETSSWGWGIQLPAFKIPLFGKSNKPADLVKTEDVSKTKEELEPENEIKEGEVFTQSISLCAETEPTTVSKEKVKIKLQQEEEKPKPEIGAVQSFEIQKEVTKSKTAQKEFSIHMKPSPSEELKPQTEIAVSSTVKTETIGRNVLLMMSEDRVDTGVTTHKTQIAESTTQVLETVTESICKTQLPMSTNLTFTKTERTGSAGGTEKSYQQKEDIILDLDEKEREPSNEYVSALENQFTAIGSGIQPLAAFEKPDFIDSEIVSITNENLKPESECINLSSSCKMNIEKVCKGNATDTDYSTLLKFDHKHKYEEFNIDTDLLDRPDIKELALTSADIPPCTANIWETKSKGVIVTVNKNNEAEQLMLNQVVEGGFGLKENQSEMKVLKISAYTEIIGDDLSIKTQAVSMKSPTESGTLLFSDFKNDTFKECVTMSKSTLLPLTSKSDQKGVKEASKIHIGEHQMTCETESKLPKSSQDFEDECAIPLKDKHDEANMHSTVLETESLSSYFTIPMIGVTVIEERINISDGNIIGKELKASGKNIESNTEANSNIQEGAVINSEAEDLRETCDQVNANIEYEVSTPKVLQKSDVLCDLARSGVTIPVSPSIITVKVLEERIYTPDEDIKGNKQSFLTKDEVSTTESPQETIIELEFLKKIVAESVVKSLPVEETLLENDSSILTHDSSEHMLNYYLTDPAKQVEHDKEEQSLRTVTVNLEEEKKENDLPDRDDSMPADHADSGICFHQLSLPKYSVSVIEENIYIEDEGNKGNNLDLERSPETLNYTMGTSAKTVGSEMMSTSLNDIIQTKPKKADGGTANCEEDSLSGQDGETDIKIKEEKKDNDLQQQASVVKSRSLFKLPSFKLPSLSFRGKKERAQNLDADLPHNDFATDLLESEKLKTQLDTDTDKEKANIHSKKVEHPKFQLPKLELSKHSRGEIIKHTSTCTDASEETFTKDIRTKNINTQKEKTETDLSPLSFLSELQPNTIVEEDIKIEFPYFKAPKLSFVDPNDNTSSVHSDNNKFYKPEHMQHNNNQFADDQFLTEEKKVSVCITNVNLSEKKMKPKRSGFKLSFSKVKNSDLSSDPQCESFSVAANHEKVGIDLHEYDLACEDELQTLDISCIANQSTLDLPQSDAKGSNNGPHLVEETTLNEMEKAMKKEINITPTAVKNITLNAKSLETAKPFDTDNGVPHHITPVFTELPVSPENKLVEVYLNTDFETQQNTESEYKSEETTQTKQPLIKKDILLTTNLVKEYEISSSETERPSFGFSLMKIKLPESHGNVNREEPELSLEAYTNMEDNLAASQPLETGIDNIIAEHTPNRQILSSKVHVPKLKTLTLSVKSSDQPECSNLSADTDDGTAKNEMSETAASSHDENSLRKKEATSNQSLNKFKFHLPSVGFTSSVAETHNQKSNEKVQDSAKLVESGTSEKKSWFKFPKLGFSSATEKHQTDKEEEDESETIEDNVTKEVKRKDKSEDSS